MDKFKGRIIYFPKDKSILINPPCTYDEFIEEADWSLYNSASDLAWDAYCRVNGFDFLDRFDDEFLDGGFRVLPMNPQIRDLITPYAEDGNSRMELNPISVFGLSNLTDAYKELCAVIVERTRTALAMWEQNHE